MTKTSKALVASTISAVIVAVIYWIIQSLISSIKAWQVGIVVFVIALIGMKWSDWVK